MYLCYGEPAPGYISKLISTRSGQYRLSSCIDNNSFSSVFTSPPPAALVLASLRRSCFPWRSHAQSTACLPWRFHAQSTKVYPGGPIPSRLKFFLCTTHTLTNSRAPISCTTLIHHSRAPLT